MAKTYTHNELVVKAHNWLINKFGCGNKVISEWHGHKEQPDVYGLGWQTIMIECKASRNDFLADKRKSFRKPGHGCGSIRYYCANKGIITENDLPTGWGLIETSGRGLKVTVKPSASFLATNADIAIQKHMLERFFWIGCGEFLNTDGQDAQNTIHNLKKLYYGENSAVDADAEINVLKQTIKEQGSIIDELKKRYGSYQSENIHLKSALQILKDESEAEVKRLDALLKVHGICGATGKKINQENSQAFGDAVAVIEDYLKQNRYHGLYNSDADCACLCGELAPGDCMSCLCNPGYIMDTDDDGDVRLGPNRHSEIL